MPEGRRVVVVNATPLITLALVDRIHLLRDLYDKVVIPPAVFQEVIAGGPGRAGFSELQAASWIETVPLADTTRADLLSDLDRGEAEVIALGQILNADLVIIDERLGRRHARRLGLPLTGTLGVLLKAKAAGLIPEIATIIDEIRRCGIRLSEALVAKVLEVAGE